MKGSTRILFFDLLIVLLFTFLAYLFVLIPPFNQTSLRIIFALPILLFLPGYLLIAAIFPRREELSGIERFTLSIGLSIAIFVFDGFAISVTQWRFRPTSIIYSLSLIILILTLITLLVRLRIPEDRRFYLDLSIFSGFIESLRSDERPSDIEKALIIALAGSIIIASGMLVYAKLTFEEEKFTMLYILGAGGKAEDYPSVVYLLEPSSITVGIENYEHAPANYTLQVKLGGYLLKEENLSLSHGEKWVNKVYFTPKHVGKHLKLEFVLYKDGSMIPYRSVHLWVDSLIDYGNLTRVREYALSDLPVVDNPDMEADSGWIFTKNIGYFRGHFTKFYQLEENATLCGYVTDNVTSKGIAYARVSINNHYGYVKTTTTNSSGYYEIPTIADHFWIVSTANGYRESATEFDISPGKRLVVNMSNDPQPIAQFNMTLEELSIINETIDTLPPDEVPEWILTLDGYVIDDVTRLPIANASVKVTIEDIFEKVLVTDRSGHFELKAIPGSATISVDAAGYSEKTTSFTISDDSTIDLRLEPANTTPPPSSMMILPIVRAGEEGNRPASGLPPWVSIIKGYAIDNVTCLPIPDASIKIRNDYGFERYTTTDKNGYFEQKVITGRSWVEAEADGYMKSSTRHDISGEYITDLRLTPESVTIQGYIHDNTTGAPISNAHVRLKCDGYSSYTRTNTSGYYEIKTIAGLIRLEVTKTGYFTNETEIEIPYGEIQIVNMTIERTPPPATVSGYVYYNHTALAGVMVLLTDHKGYEETTVTDRNGYFETEILPGHIYLQVLPSAYMTSSVEFDVGSGESVILREIELDALPESSYQIDYPSKTPIQKGYYGEIYQDIVSDEGLATISFKVSDSYTSNRSEGYLFKQVLLNNLVVWEDDVAEDEVWQEINVPVTLNNGTNRLALRVYAKKESNNFPLSVWWDSIRIKPFEKVTKDVATSFTILDAEGTRENYPTKLYLGKPAAVIANIENNEGETINYILQVKLNDILLNSKNVTLEDGSKWEGKITFTPNQIGSLYKLEFLLFKDEVKEEPYKKFTLWVSSDIDYDNLDLLEEYDVSPLPALVNGDMESGASDGWTYTEHGANFTGEITDSTMVSPMHSYEIGHNETHVGEGEYADITQNFTSEIYPATVVISFNVRDSYTAKEDGYFLKQVLLNDELIWEEDVAGDEGWQYKKIPVQLDAGENRLTLRLLAVKASDNFPIKLWWDDVKIEPVTALREEAPLTFSILDAEGTDKNYPTQLHLGEPANFISKVDVNERGQIKYILQIKLDGRVLEERSRWLEKGMRWEENISIVPDQIGDGQQLEFMLFRGVVEGTPYRYFHLTVSTDLNYDRIEPLLRYGITPLPILDGGTMQHISAWSSNFNGSFRGFLSCENASSPLSYCIEQNGASNKGDFGEIWQNISASSDGVAVLSFNVRDSYTTTSSSAKNLTKEVILNNKIIWSDDIAGSDSGYTGWVVEEYTWFDDEWSIKEVPAVKSGWRHVDVPVYLNHGENNLRLGVYARDPADGLAVRTYWDDVEIKQISDLVKTGDNIRMKRYGW